jgi:hypothetical protein
VIAPAPAERPWVHASNGDRIVLEDPSSITITIDEIAHVLSNLCRFGGRTRWFYSVAQHSILVSRLVPPELAAAGLLHEIDEAYLGLDVATPLKRLLPGLEILAWRWQLEGERVFGVPINHHKVKEADVIALATERRDLLTDPYRHQWSEPYESAVPHPDRIVPLLPQEAEAAFHIRARELGIGAPVPTLDARLLVQQEGRGP